ELISGIEISLSPEEREKLRARQEQNRINEVERMLAFSDTLALMDREYYMGRLEKMAVVSRSAPHSSIVPMFHKSLRSPAAATARDRVRDTGRGLIRGIQR